MKVERHREFLKSLNAREIYVGFSGGADSTALLLLLKRYSQELQFMLKAVHFQHNLRGAESVADAIWCRVFCEKHAVDFTEISLDVTGSQRSSEGIEATARRLRNDYWQGVAVGEQRFVALGHHADDRAENLMLRLCRGSNVTGATSMRSTQEIGAVTYIRPLLDISRDEIIHFLSDANITDWCHDASNDDTVYKRNFIRHNVMPELYSSLDYSKAGIQHSLNALSEDADFIEQQAREKYGDIAGCADVSTSFLMELHPAIFIRVLRYWLRDQLGSELLPNHKLIARLKAELNRDLSGETKMVPLNGAVSLRIKNGTVTVSQESSSRAERPKAVQWNWKKQNSIEWNGVKLCAKTADKIPEDLTDSVCFDADTLPDTLTIRCWEPGDTMVPFGRKSPVKLKKLFTDRKIAAEDKDKYPLICDGETILWIPKVKRSSACLSSKSVVVIFAVVQHV